MHPARTHWPWLAPLATWLVLLGSMLALVPPWVLLTALAVAVVAAVHHAEIVAHKVGEPFGTLVLAIAVTAIELGLILTLMNTAENSSAGLARDTVFAVVMIILNGLLGVCILVGAIRHREQSFQQSGVSAALATLSALTVLTLVLPNYTVSEPGPVYSPPQLAFVAVISFLLYVTFVSVQTIRHRDYFLPTADIAANEAAHAPPPSVGRATLSAILLVFCLGAVVLLAKSLSAPIGNWLTTVNAPHATIGVIIAATILLPESVAATRAALANRLQTSINLGLGSALATIGLTIPAVAATSLMLNLPIALGLDAKSSLLLFLTLIVATQTLATGRTTILHGTVHLVILGVYLFTTVVP